MSIESMKSSCSTASASRPELGVDTSGLPAWVISARIRPSPGVSISSASADTGSSPSASGSPRTRVCQRSMANPRPLPGLPVELRCPAAARVNMAPPSRSRLPVSTFSTSTSQLVRVPNDCVVVPIRPYTAARSAPASSRASRRICSAPMPHAGATASGVKPASSSRTSLEALQVVAHGAGVHQALVEQRPGHGRQQVGVVAGADEVVLVGHLGRARAARVDHHHAAAALAGCGAGARACRAR